MPAGQVLLERDTVALLDAETRGRRGAEARDMADRLVTEDQRAARLGVFEIIRPSLPQTPQSSTRSSPPSAGSAGSSKARTSVRLMS